MIMATTATVTAEVEITDTLTVLQRKKRYKIITDILILLDTIMDMKTMDTATVMDTDTNTNTMNMKITTDMIMMGTIIMVTRTTTIIWGMTITDTIIMMITSR